MADGSPIEWLQRPGTKPATWNPIIAWRNVTQPDGSVKRLRGWYCEHATTGCINCYSEKQNIAGARGGTKLPYKPGHRKDVEIELHEETLLKPLHWKSPRTIFPCSMTDLFGEWVTDEMLDRIFAVMALTPQHTYLPLTKRAERMRQWFANVDRADHIGLAMLTLVDRIPHGHRRVPWPLPNVWLGVSCERQEEADERLVYLVNTPAAIRFMSYEPALGPMLLQHDDMRDGKVRNWLGKGGLNWVIDGGESGSDARPYDLDASRSVQAQCRAAGVAYFRKQFGARPFEREPSAWPNGTPHGDGSLSLMPDGFGRYFVNGLKSRKGGDDQEWPEDLRVREFPVIDRSVTQSGVAVVEPKANEATAS